MSQDHGHASSARVGLASLPLTSRLDEAVAAITAAVTQASELGADILCLPESCLPGHRVQPDVVPAYSQDTLSEALATVAGEARRHGVATVLGTEHLTPAGLQIIATVIDDDGTVLRHQARTQLDPLEEAHRAAQLRPPRRTRAGHRPRMRHQEHGTALRARPHHIGVTPGRWALPTANPPPPLTRGHWRGIRVRRPGHRRLPIAPLS